MNNHIKLAAIILIFILASATESYSSPIDVSCYGVLHNANSDDLEQLRFIDNDFNMYSNG